MNPYETLQCDKPRPPRSTTPGQWAMIVLACAAIAQLIAKLLEMM
jgi:hypothetical protein